jgi:membrane associated rhomboid family serine protease
LHSLREKREDVASRLKAIFLDFWMLFNFYIAIFSLCAIVFTLNLVYPWLDGFLVASRSTSWGVITSLFVHSDLSHLVMNLIGLFSFVLVFSFTNYYLPSDEVVSRVHFFIIAILAATVLSNILWIIVANMGSIGASGLVYASEGAVTGFCLVNFWDLYSDVRIKSTGKRGDLLVNLLVFLAICGWMVFYTNSFLSYGREVNILIHGSSFVIAFILTIEWGNLRNLFKK